ncbi:MAG: DivIVA domain-containing protein [bacterium]|nr:DivIVA domain-containing protein [bacterium]
MEKFSITLNGYDPEEVNSFIDDVISRMEKLVVENQRLSVKIKRIQATKNNEAALEEKLNKAIMAVQETSDRMKELARTESAMIIEEARRNADAIIHEALLNAEKTEFEANRLKKNIAVYKNKIENILKSQLELNEEIDKIDFD